MTQDEITEMAKEAHRKLVTEVYVGHMGQLDPWTIELLKIFANLVAAKALAQPEQEQEPVTTVEDNSQQWKGMDGAIAFHLIERHADGWNDIRKMMGEWLSANTPQRTWVGLTDEEVDECYYWKDRQWTTDELVRHVEAKLKEKNT